MNLKKNIKVALFVTRGNIKVESSNKIPLKFLGTKSGWKIFYNKVEVIVFKKELYLSRALTKSTSKQNTFQN